LVCKPFQYTKDTILKRKSLAKKQASSIKKIDKLLESEQKLKDKINKQKKTYTKKLTESESRRKNLQQQLRVEKQKFSLTREFVYTIFDYIEENRPSLYYQSKLPSHKYLFSNHSNEAALFFGLHEFDASGRVFTISERKLPIDELDIDSSIDILINDTVSIIDTIRLQLTQ
jgi:hypothetical protein